MKHLLHVLKEFFLNFNFKLGKLTYEFKTKGMIEL